MSTLTLQMPPSLKFTDEEFEKIVEFNKELRLELTASGELIIMSPTGGETGNRNFDLIGQIWFWNRKNKLGKAFDSST
ncbi:MAG: Uma2 family endonuclease, partial [Cyanobacteria bacterium J06573_2]